MKKFPFILAVFLTLSLLSANFIPEWLIKNGVEKFASELFQTEVNINEVDLDFFDGKLELSRITLKNPAGFRQENALEIANIKYVLNTGSFFDEKLVHLKEVSIDGVLVNIEFGVKGHNYRHLADKYGLTYRRPAETVENQSTKPEGERTKVVIDDLSVTNSKIIFIAVGPIGKPKKKEEFPIKDLHMKDVGKRFDLSFADAVTDVLLEGSHNLPEKFKRYPVEGVLENIKEQYEADNGGE